MSRPSRNALARTRKERLADLAELVLSVAREINFRVGTEGETVRLTATEIHVMRYINRHPGAMPKDVAKGVGLQRSNFSVTLRSLKAKGLVAPSPDPLDGRSTHLFPTDVAEKNLAHHRERWTALLSTALDDSTDIRECIELLTRIDDALAGLRWSQ